MLSDEQARNISVEELAQLTLQVLQGKRGSPSQVQAWKYSNGSWNLGGVRDAIYGDEQQLDDRSPERAGTIRHYGEKFAQVKQRLFNENLIYRDPDQSSDTYILLTEEGKIIDTSAPIFGVVSTDEVIKWIVGSGLPLDPVVEGYLREAIRAAKVQLWLSATFMLGAASERLLYVTAEHVDALLKDPVQSAKLMGMTKAKTVRDWIVEHIPALRKAYPNHKEAFRDVESTFNTLVELYRIQRNEAGHPCESMPSYDRHVTEANLRGFGTYKKRVDAILLVQP